MLPLFTIRKRKGRKMDIKAEIEAVRSQINRLKHWDEIVEEEMHNAMWGHGRSFDDVKVQTSQRPDKMEDAIIKAQELAAQREKIICNCWDKQKEIARIIEQYAGLNDMTVLHRYLMGFDVEQLPLKAYPENAQRAVNRAIQRLQESIDKG